MINMTQLEQIALSAGSGNTQSLIEVRHLYKSFGKNRVLIDFNMDLIKGERLVILGRSGCGKSVLIKCIIGLLRPDQGSIRVFGDDISRLNEENLDRMRMRVGFLFQSNALYDSMTVRQNLEFPLRRHGTKSSDEQVGQLVLSTLRDVGLEEAIDMMPSELSGGMRKRIALARTLILRPRIILYDEPTAGLDPVTGKEIIELMIKVHQKYESASIIISHDMNCVKMASDRVLILLEGKCYAQGRFESLQAETDVKVRQFFE